MNCSQIVDHRRKKTCILPTQPPIKPLRHIRELGRSKKQTHSWDNPSNPTQSTLFSTEWKYKKEQKSSNGQVLFHRKSYTTEWTSSGVRDMFQCTQWILGTWGSGRRAVLYIELPNNKIEFHVTIYRFLFTFFKINWPFSSDSPFHILKASYLWKVERRVATNKNWKTDVLRSHFKRNSVPFFLKSEKWCQ